MKIEWVDGFEIRVKVDHVKADHDEVIIAANREGMLSLAKQLIALAEAAPGQHIHYDEYNSLEEGSIVERNGSKGKMRSVYLRDPDGNLVEFASYK